MIAELDRTSAAHPVILLQYASLEYHEHGCTSHFLDGTSYGATPHSWEPHYSVISHRCGYGDDLLAYCREHELAHHLIAEFLLDGPSPILWGLAHGEPVPPKAAAFEEIAAQALQRFVRAKERPIVGGVDWDALAARFEAVSQPCPEFIGWVEDR